MSDLEMKETQGMTSFYGNEDCTKYIADIPRDKPCLCGSGAKFKDCCLKLIEEKC